jgi:hypothetical protein
MSGDNHPVAYRYKKRTAKTPIDIQGVDIMTSNPPIEDLLKAIDEMWRFWRNAPDGSRYQALTRQLGLFVQAVVQDATQNGWTKLTSPITGVGKVAIHVVVTDGRRRIINHHHVTDFDEVVGEYLMTLCKKYLKFPDIQHVRSAAYIRMGIVQKAYTLERSLKNLREKETLTNELDAPFFQTGVAEKKSSKIDADEPLKSDDSGYSWQGEVGPDVSAVAVIEELEDNRIFERLKTLWFYPYSDHAAAERFPKSFSGLSLRYVYVDLRYQAGVSLTEIAGELNVHSSRLTELKKEYTQLFPGIESKVWLNLEKDFKPIRVEDQMLHRMNLKGVHSRYSLLRIIDDQRIREKILRSKRILWRLFRFAVELVKKPGDGFSETLHLLVLDETKRPDVKIILKQDQDSIYLSDSCLLAQKCASVAA